MLKLLQSVLNRSGYYAMPGDISVFLLYFSGPVYNCLNENVSYISKYSFIFGLAANVIGLMYFPATLITGEYGYLAIVFAAPFTVIWQANIALNYIKLLNSEICGD